MNFWVILSILISAFYGIRGVLIEMNVVRKVNDDRREELKWKCPILTHYIQGFILYSVSGAAGFLASYALYKIYINTNGLSDISTGTGAAVIFLSLLSIIGISGELPYVIKFGKLPGAS